MSIKITHYIRDQRPTNFSIERLYEDVRNELPSDCETVVWECRNPSKGVWRRFSDAWAARRAQGDVNHVTGDTHYLTFFLDRQRTVLTIHDLVTVKRSKGLKKFVFWFFWFWLPVLRSHKVVTISEATRRALLDSVRCQPTKVKVIHNPVSAEFKAVDKKFNDTCPRILQVGTKDNKNLKRVVEAIAGLSCKLVIIGPLSPDLSKHLARHSIDYENHVGLTRAELVNQYISADMLVFVSTFEGFGLPIVEANAVGRAVITSSLPPMTEVAGDSACLVDPYDVASIRAGIGRLIQEPEYRESLVDRGFINAQRFNCKSVASQYAELYRQIAK